MEKKYQSLVDNKIFMGGASDIEDMVNNEQIEVIVDLREESSGSAYPSPNVQWIQVPIGDNADVPQQLLFKEAIDQVVSAYKEGKKVGFHCGGGKGRTGAVAIGTLIELGKASTIEAAENMAKSIRPLIHIREPQRDALEKLYPQ